MCTCISWVLPVPRWPVMGPKAAAFPPVALGAFFKLLQVSARGCEVGVGAPELLPLGVVWFGSLPPWWVIISTFLACQLNPYSASPPLHSDKILVYFCTLMMPTCREIYWRRDMDVMIQFTQVQQNQLSDAEEVWNLVVIQYCTTIIIQHYIHLINLHNI